MKRFFIFDYRISGNFFKAPVTPDMRGIFKKFSDMVLGVPAPTKQVFRFAGWIQLRGDVRFLSVGEVIRTDKGFDMLITDIDPDQNMNLIHVKGDSEDERSAVCRHESFVVICQTI